MIRLKAGCVTVPFLKVCEQYRAFLSRSRLAHDLATFDSLLLARWHTAMTVGLQVIDRKRAIMVPVRVERQHQRRTWRHDPHARMAMAMSPALVTFGTLEPTLSIHSVFRKIGRLATRKHPRLKTAHPLGDMLVYGVSA